MILWLLYNFGGEGLAFCAGLITLRILNKGFRIVWLQVFIAFAVEITAYCLRKYGWYNVWMYNLYLPLDCGLLLLAAYYFHKARRVIYLSGFAIFLTVWVYFLLKNDINYFQQVSYAIDSLLLLGFYLYVLYCKVIGYRGSVTTLPFFWLSLGILLFYGCNAPYFFMLDRLTLVCSREESNYVEAILKILSNIRYLLIAYSFFLYYFQNRKEPYNPSGHAKR